MNPRSWCSAQRDGTGQCVCVRLDLGWTPFWVANALDVSCVTSSDIDSFSHQEAGGWGKLAGPSSPAQHSHDHSFTHT